MCRCAVSCTALVVWLSLLRGSSSWSASCSACHDKDRTMTPGARLAAAIEIFADIAARRRPAADTLKEWGLSHRFAGSGDRAGIAGLVYDALRRRASSAWIIGG